MSREKQIDEMCKDLVEIFDEEYEKRRLITADFTAIKMSKKGYRKQEWISVNERLPQVCGVYICCVKTKGGATFTKTAEFVPEMKMWFGKFGEIKNIVTHWMPLPEPPKGE